jgi:hypothetical protein
MVKMVKMDDEKQGDSRSSFKDLSLGRLLLQH